ncbi:serine/threonine-protein kinase [Streptomyces sp. NPDC006208]|uniref:serine/threonine-protein kinase n=1 Tax=Streptomyces sp. NPDC006208 TaxID=3156734 RepID=UPI0033A484B4
MSEAGRLVAGRYRLAEHVGRGGMGTVWRAEDELLGRDVAVKQLHIPAHLDDREVRILHERTRREATSAARISHPHVVVVHDVVVDEGRPCIVMEYIPSITLSAAIKEQGPLHPGEAARIGAAVAGALRAAHEAGVLHRDVKPANVLLGHDGRIVLTDFGIALPAGAPSLTTTGEWVGSVDYVAPERLVGEAGGAGPASDLWSLGATLYHAVEGRPPFRRASAIATAHAIAVDEPEPLRAPRLGGVIAGLLVKEPAARMHADRAERLLAEAAEVAESPVETWKLSRPAAESEPRTSRSPGRGRRAALSSVAVLAVGAVVAGAALVMNGRDGDGDGDGGGDKPNSSSSSLNASVPPVPAGYRLRKEGKGVAVPVPKDWKRTTTGGGEIAYVDPSGLVGLRVSATRFAGGDALRHWREVEEAQTRRDNPGYERVRMNGTTFRGGPAGYWEFTFEGRERGFRAVELAFAEPDGTQHVIYLSAPAALWSTYRPVFDNAVEGVRLPG